MAQFRRSAPAALILAGLLASPAFAESPAGRWAFETAMVNANCKLTGEMTIWGTRRADAFACRFVSVQTCTGDPPMEIKVAQTCTADRHGADISIQSKIDKPVSVSPPEMLPAVEARYAPDHFEVTLNGAGDEMTGLFHSLSEAAVRFWRLEDLVG